MVQVSEVIKKILEVTNFDGNVDEFINAFNSLALSNATLTLYESLPDGIKEELKNELKSDDVFADRAKIVQKYFSEQQISDAVNHETALLLDAFLTETLQNLPDDQKQILTEFEKEM